MPFLSLCLPLVFVLLLDSFVSVGLQTYIMPPALNYNYLIRYTMNRPIERTNNWSKNEKIFGKAYLNTYEGLFHQVSLVGTSL